MTINYNATGARRKALVQTIAAVTGATPTYKAAPTFAYEIDLFTVTKDGALEFSDRSDSEIVEKVLAGIAAAGFACENATQRSEDIGLTVTVPIGKVSVSKLTQILHAKGALICKALGITATPIEIGEDSVSFPWFDTLPDADSANAYTHIISAICRMSIEQKRITAVAREVENEKYAFRCFLLRLGFIGSEYKTMRRILLQNLEGNAAFKGGTRHDVSE